jgi:predicted transcriptional regulator of viral defense system
MAPTTESYRKGLTSGESFLLSSLAREGKAVFSMVDARQILGAKTKQALSRLSKKKWVLRLRRGLYVIVRFWSALNHHGLTDQIPRTVFVATTRPRKPQ